MQTRGVFLQGAGATRLLSVLGGCATDGVFGKDGPGYLIVDGRKADFDRLKSISGKGSLIGEDYDFKHQIPLLFPFPGEIIYVGRDPDSWGRNVIVDSGVIQYSLNHMDSLYIEKGEDIRVRLRVAGTQGRDGFNARGIVMFVSQLWETWLSTVIYILIN